MRRDKQEEREHLFDNPRNVRIVLRSLYTICAALVLSDFVYKRHVTHAWETLTGFYAVYGFVACVILVLAATQMRKILMRREDYYDLDD